MKHGSLFSGIGGFDLAAEWAGWENVFHCELNEFGKKVLKYYWPEAISYHDIKKTDFTIHRGNIDILTGGFPCQGFSLAGARLGTEDDRYLWPEYLRAIDECQPTWVIGENVTGILSMEDKSGIYREVFAQVENRKITRFREIDYYEAIYTRQAKMLVNSICESLEERGYEVQTFAIPAAGLQAPHIRERIWFVAYVKGKRDEREKGNIYQKNGRSRAEQLPIVNKSNTRPASTKNVAYRSDAGLKGVCGRQNEVCKAGNVADTPGSGRHAGRGCENVNNCEDNTTIGGNLFCETKGYGWERVIADTICKGLEIEPCQSGNYGKKQPTIERDSNQWEIWPTQPPVCTGDDGFSSGLDGITFPKWRNESIKAAGNAVVPHIPYEIFKAINKQLIK